MSKGYGAKACGVPEHCAGSEWHQQAVSIAVSSNADNEQQCVVVAEKRLGVHLSVL